MRNLVFCDTETTGLNHDKHRVVEICVCRVQGADWNKVGLLKVKFRLTDEAFAEAEPEALAINGYRHRNCKAWDTKLVIDSQESKWMWAKIARHLKGAVFVNQNAPFDLGFIQSELARHGLPAYEPEDVWEVRDFSSKVLEAAGQSGRSLHPAYTVSGGYPQREHRADADVLRAIWVIASGVERFPETWKDRPEVQDTAAMRKYVSRKILGFAPGDLVGRKHGKEKMGVALRVYPQNNYQNARFVVDVLLPTGKILDIPLCTATKCSGREYCGRPQHLVTST